MEQVGAGGRNRRLEKYVRKIIRAVCVSSALFASSAYGSETWVCVVHPPPPVAGGVTVSETLGHNLITLTDSALIVTSGLSDTSPKRSYQLLLNNDVGAVGANAYATDSPAKMEIKGLPPKEAAAVLAQLNLPKTLVSTYVVVLNKKDHTMREGIVTSWRVDQGKFGDCEPQASESSPPGTDPHAAQPSH